jgi:sporulation integral membrane protein YlbJ
MEASLRFQSHIILLLTIPLIVAFIIHPGIVTEGALQGLSVWREILLPALLPFFVITEWLTGLGFVKLTGVILGPLMRPLFRLPGCAGFVMVFGFLSGYPVAAKLTAELLRNKELTRSEGERLIGIATTADPMFLISAVAIGFLNTPAVASTLIFAHYGASILLAWLLRWRGHRQQSSRQNETQFNIIQSAISALRKHRQNDRRAGYEIFRDAIANSLRLIFIIGGLVVFFCIYVSLLTSIHLMNYFYSIVYFALSLISVDSQSLAQSVANGVFEVTLGVKLLALTDSIPSTVQIVAICFILSWGGLSVHAQIMSLLHDCNVRYVPFVCYRVLHGLLAACLALMMIII